MIDWKKLILSGAPRLQITPEMLKSRASIEGSKLNARPPAAILRQPFALDATFTPQRFVMDGDILFTDSDSTGTIYLHINSPSAPPIPFPANTVLRGIPFGEIYVENKVAQSGKIANLWFGYAAEFVPPNTQLNSIVGNVAVIEQGITYGASYKSSTNLAANTPDNVWAAASNVNGAVLWSAYGMTSNGSGIAFLSFIAKATAPASPIDGDVLASNCVAAAFTGSFSAFINMARATRISSGKRGDFITGSAEVSAMRSALYTLL